MIYIVKEEYLPNAAETNRLFAFVKGFIQLGKDVSILYVNNCPYKDIHGACVVSPIGGFKSRILHKFTGPISLYRILKRTQSDDCVIFYSAMLVLVVPLLLRKQIKAKLYYECTENPEVIRPNTLLYRCYRRLLFRCCKRLDGLFVISQSLKQYFIEKGVNKERIHIINMIVDPNRFDNIYKQEVESPYIAYCGTASNNKDGVDELIKAFAIVSCNYPQYKLYIIGKGLTRDDDSGNLKLVNSLRLNDKVVFTGVVEAERMPQLLKNANILALDRPDNKQAKYGFPTKLGEYLLTENPVVVTQVGDIPLFLKDRESALFAEPQNDKSFASCIIWVIEHPVEASVIGRNGADVAREHFDGLKEAEKVVDIIGA